jgi:hypothetical protein
LRKARNEVIQGQRQICDKEEWRKHSQEEGSEQTSILKLREKVEQ